jgi:hypothetical protein
MKPRRCCSLLLIVTVILLLAVPLFAESRRRKYVPPPAPTPDVEGTVLSLRRLQFGTYVEVMREDGIQEWIDIKNEEGLEVRSGQRVAYSTRPGVYENNSFGRVRTGEDFRIVTPHSDGQVYRGTGSDGAMVFTDNPTTDTNLYKAVPGGTKQKGKKKQGAKASQKQADDDVVYVDVEERKRQEALREELNNYTEQVSVSVPERKAKRAKPRQR